MAYSGFSNDGKYYSTITEDGRLKVWDTETNVLKHEYTPDLHLTAPPICLKWLTVTQSSHTPHKSSKRKSSLSENETQCIALGTASGKILIYSISQAKVESILEEKNKDHNSKINSLDWHRKYGLLSSDKDNFVNEWDLTNASIRYKYNLNVENKKKCHVISSIKIISQAFTSASKFLAAASGQLHVWRLHEGDATIIRSFGHIISSQSLLTGLLMGDKICLLEGSQNERLIALWDVTITQEDLVQTNNEETPPNNKKRKKSISQVQTITTPKYNFILEDAPKMMDCCFRDDENRMGLAVATRSGVVHYFDHVFNGSSVKPIKPSVTIHTTTSEAHPLPVQCCGISNDQIVVGYSNGPVLMFERVTPDIKSKTQVLIRETTKSKKTKKQTGDGDHRLESDRTNITYLEPVGNGVTRKRTTPGGTIEVPMEARLANLALDPQSRSKTAINQNMTKLLVQGLHSKDKNLIQMVLRKNSPAVAMRTVANLPTDYLPDLLEQLVIMATQRTPICAAACTWTSAVVRNHSALLLASTESEASSHLSHLLAIFTHRRSHLCQLLNLKGRLDLISAQRNVAENPIENQEPILDYNDTSSDEEVDLERNQSSGAESWDEESASDPSDDEGVSKT